MESKGPGEILLIDKPTGITSFGVIRILRKELNIKKIGHAGTLDPLATGLMLMGVGRGTKKLKDLIGLSKRYRAEVLLGVKTDTADTDGEIIEEKDIPDISRFSPVSQVIGIRPGNFCKIIRPSKTSIKSDFYRVCLNK